MDKKYLKKVLAGFSIASLVGMAGMAMGAGGWSGSKKGAVSTQKVTEEAPTPGYGIHTPGYGVEKAKEAAPGYGTPAAGYGTEKAKEAVPGYGTPAPGYGVKK